MFLVFVRCFLGMCLEGVTPSIDLLDLFITL